MNFEFRVAYATVVGESLWLEMTMRVGKKTVRQVLPMKWKDAQHWELKVEAGKVEQLEYRYVFKREDGLELEEFGDVRKWQGEDATKHVLFLDDWKSAGSEDRVYEGKIFEIADAQKRELGNISNKRNHEFHLHMARLPEGAVPCLLGGCHGLGSWDYAKALPMVEVARNHWQVNVDLPMDERSEYKYGIYRSSEANAIRLEGGAENRVLGDRSGAGMVRVSDECFRRSANQRFRAAGVAIPVFSLRSEEGCGVGEFSDLKAMGNWAMSCGMKMIQILPINDTTSSRTWTDSYPYSAISVYALHPIYLRLDGMTVPLPNEAEFRETREVLNRAKQLDYEAVMAVKWRVTREMFDAHQKSILNDPSFLDFLKRNRDWVLDYAVFSLKRDEFGTADFSKWGNWKDHDAKKIDALSSDASVMYFVWLQFELDKQLTDAVAHLHAKGVALKGDLPIGVDKESVDAWVAPRLFNMDTQTGAPPDAFAVKGQNWGFPTYDWDEMRKDGYAWWRSRFEKLSRYFDAYRIDHILGFFRIWQIPTQHVDGIMGWFEPALPVKLEEFAERGVVFDYDRFCKPFIQENDLLEIFGELAHGVRQDFLVDYGLGCYGLKNDFSTQRGILEFFEKLKPSDWANQAWLRAALLDLAGEVLFFEVGGSHGKEFHPRMRLSETRSFKALAPEIQEVLRQIHEDYFYLRQDRFWEVKAYEKLPVMRSASDMLLCGEDLGMVPGCVPGVMSQLGMLSLEIQRWPKIYGGVFSDPALAPYMSVISTGTHDMETLRQWWQDDEKVRSRFAREMLGIASPEPELSGGMARRIIQQHLASPAMWAVFPFQDLLAMDEILRSENIEGERINVPAITPFYWRWRMEMNMEALAKEIEFNQGIREMISDAGR
ncbi:MAG: 4-alpha-glucanotransferase [Verrucomicrobiota bacterium]